MLSSCTLNLADMETLMCHGVIKTVKGEDLHELKHVTNITKRIGYCSGGWEIETIGNGQRNQDHLLRQVSKTTTSISGCD